VTASNESTAGGLDESLLRHLQPITPGRRFTWALVAWLLVASSQPGLGRPDGFGHTAFVALAPWALVACRPGRRAFLCEWLAASVGMALIYLWMRHLMAWVVVPLALVPSLYMALGGVALRRLARRWPLALAVPAAWFLGEMLRWYMPPPLSFGWWRLGSFLHDTEWITGSARVWGTWGLSWVAASFAGWCADLWRLRGLNLDQDPPFPPALVHTLGLGPLVIGMVLTAAVPAPPMEDGPRVLLVQPGIEQQLKAHGEDPLALYIDLLEDTAKGLDQAEGPVDLVCWGETMFPFTLVDPEARAAHARGARPPEWAERDLPADSLDFSIESVSALIEGVLFGRAGALSARWRAQLESRGVPEEVLNNGLLAGSAFLTGIEQLVLHDGDLRRRNAVALWSARGEPLGVASKVHLVPAAEDPGVYIHLPLLRGIMRRVGGYIPDFVTDERPGVLELPREGGAPWAIGASVCYDQVFDDPFAARAGEVDLHLIVSNEAWYEESVEMDHMVAFARLDALASGRSVVRATNSGISCVLSPAGELVGVLEGPHGKRKMSRGSLSVVVPVPAGQRTETPWVRTYRLQPWLWAALVGILLWKAGNRPADAG
jgi:apolipoprotein N-acyltransferase